MKKILALILTVALVATFAACTSKTTDTDDALSTDIVTDDSQDTQNEEVSDNNISNEDKEVSETPKKEEPKKENNKKEEPKKEPVKPAEKPVKPAEKPAEPAPSKPVEKPAEKQEESTQTATLGNILLADFKAKASSGMGAEEIANALMGNSSIKFNGAVMAVEPGLLSGFDNAEITGFKSGYMFAPMIGSIPFIGYVFELENAADVSSFISVLSKNANKRWNVCVEADEMITGSAGNKVFFVMCPKSLEE